MNDKILFWKSTFIKEAYETYKYVDLEKVVGSYDTDYAGKTWYEAFLYLRNPENIIRAIENPSYYDSPENLEGFLYYELNGQFYIVDGNHRTIIAKILGVKKIKAKVVLFRENK